MTIKLDLSQQKYQVFDVDPESSILDLKNKNFIFGKNGSGKSTLCEMIINQFLNDYDVHVFSGFNNVLEDKKLNAIVLGEDNISAKKELDSIELKIIEREGERENLENILKSLDWNKSYLEEGIEKHPLYINFESLKEKYEKQKNEIEIFFQAKAKELKEHKNPQLTKTSYNKNDLSKDIQISKILDDKEKENYERTLRDKLKSVMPKNYKIGNIDFKELINNINELLIGKVEEVKFIEEIQDNSNRKEFAEQGLKIHKAGENCSFCGNEVKEDRIKELKSFISVSAIQEYEDKINKQVEEIDRLIEKVQSIKKLDKEKFYGSYNSEVININKDIEIKKNEYESLLKMLKEKLNEKAKSVFRTFNKIDEKIPDNELKIEKKINELIDKNNDWTKNIDENQNIAMKKLRLHYVGIKLKEKDNYKSNWQGYEIENHELSKLTQAFEQNKKDITNKKLELKGSSSDNKDNTLFFLEKEMSKLYQEKKEILKKTKNTQKLVSIINNKLKISGKTNLELALVKEPDNIEHYQIKDGESIRSIDKLSTGEKNIVGFLYFLESLSYLEKQNTKNKIIVFDDPMNSNDDTMQYLIITEIQKLYTNKYLDKFDSKKDYFLCLTHNAHFYLNVQPHGNFKEWKKVNEKWIQISKYEKNYFYRVEEGKIQRITSQKDDFNTQYEFLWIELKSLYTNDLLNSMLNSMRRIIETYIKFNKINPIDFYRDKEEHQKLFNVNSHSIDDHSIEVIGRNKVEIVNMFKNLFESNNAKNHFKTYWDIE